ncbi:MAG: phosphate signaling complex protein PhoU [Anaerolineaceae bacterium]|jgi:phosphate transport system protein|nr:phosphate signaling complex protein PhoU [Anaerolineaceae bacterium]HNX45910.1 phosphate signaling complex protein PhoU [Anaerolineaceae bacterium]HPT24626.1 phosphate signaling complex protein PhoU [Anaerolineaceae bacterium]
MARLTLDRELRLVQDEILILGSLVEQAILNAVDALRRRDIAAAMEVQHNDRRINNKRFAIENRILILLATQSPMAHDLRLLAGMLEVITELERIGDYAKGIAKVCVRLAEEDTLIPIREITTMADKAISMLHRALDAFIAEDEAAARQIPLEDDEVDELYNLVYHKLIQTMINDPQAIDHANQILWVIHNLERTADRVTNICERIVFIHTGELMEMDSEDDESEDEDENLDTA